MSLKEREQGILDYLGEHHEASVTELCHALFVSEPTMRRDLATLHQQGKLIRTHGGAANRHDPWENLPQVIREREHSEAKAIIGRKCLSLIAESDTIMVDASSTALSLLRLLPEKKSVVVITNNAKAPLLLAETNVKTLVSGGELAKNTYAYVGSYAEDFMRDFHADIAFFSVRTLTRDGKLTDNAIAENAVRRIMLKNSRRRVLMLDSEKIGPPCISTLCDLGEIDCVVCERNIAPLFPEYAGKFLV